MKVVDLFILGTKKERHKFVCYNRIIKDFLENTFGSSIEMDDKKIKNFLDVKISFGQCWIIIDKDCNLLPVYADMPDKMMIMLVDISVLALTSLGNEDLQDIKLLNSYFKKNFDLVLGEDIEEPDLNESVKPTPFLKEVLKNSTVLYEKDKEQEKVENIFVKLIDDLIKEDIKQQLFVKPPEEQEKLVEPIEQENKPVVKKVEKEVIDIQEPVVLVKEPVDEEIIPEAVVSEPSELKEVVEPVEDIVEQSIKEEVQEPIKMDDKPEQVKITVKLDENNKAKVETIFENKKEEPKKETKPVVEVKNEEVKEETQVLGNDSSSDGETNESQAYETITPETKQNDVTPVKETQQIVYEIISPTGEVLYHKVIQNSEPMTVEQILMQSGLAVKNTGGFIESINEVQNVGMSGWVFEVNNAPVMVSAADYVVNPTDQITWKYVDFSKMMPETETEKHI